MSKLSKALIAAAGNSGGAGLTVEDVFSTYLYTGTDSAQTITNGIDLDGEGGLVWTKQRDIDPYNHMLVDTEQGLGYWLESNTTDAAGSFQHISVNSDGYNILGGYGGFNQSPSNYASWTFRKAEKFFDVVTYTGTGSARTVAHNLGSVPAAMIIKRTSTSGSNWRVYHTSIGNGQALSLNTTDAAGATTSLWNSTTPTDSVFTLGDNGNVNQSGQTFVAYLFASDAGGFGDDGSESIIKCGSYTGTGSALDVSLGFEPQWIMFKRSDSIGDWLIYDVMRGIVTGGSDERLEPNTSDAAASSVACEVTATGFTVTSTGTYMNASGGNYIYIAIRRPMKTPESGTEVFDPSFRITGDPTIASGFVTDMGIVASRTGGGTTDYHLIGSRLTGNLGMTTTSTNAEVTRGLEPLKWDYNNGWGGSDTASSFAVWYSFKRATGFFDVVAYTGNGTAGTTQAHNLGVAPELMIVKQRDTSRNWTVYSEFSGPTKYQVLNNILLALDSIGMWNNTSPTASIFTVGDSSATNASAGQYIAYLFASVAGVSKVGSYTGTGSNVDVDCGFSAGARFILIKRTDENGDWYVWDSVRGIVAGNDPYLLLNSTAAEVTSTDYIDPLASGFTVTSSAPAALNASGGSFVYLAIA